VMGGRSVFRGIPVTLSLHWVFLSIRSQVQVRCSYSCSGYSDRNRGPHRPLRVGFGIQACMLLRSKQTTIEKPTIKKQSYGLKPQPNSSLQYGSAEHFNIPIQLILGGKLINTIALIDSGATSNFIHIDLVQQHNIPPLGRHQVIPGIPWLKKHNPAIQSSNYLVDSQHQVRIRLLLISKSIF
jgi:hypothetical protein